MTNRSTKIEPKLKKFWKLLKTDSNKAEVFYHETIWPIMGRAILNLDSKFFKEVAKIVRKHKPDKLKPTGTGSKTTH